MIRRNPINIVSNLWNKWLHRHPEFIVKWYIEAGENLGFAISCGTEFDSHQYSRLEDRWKKWEFKYRLLGYQAIPLAQFIEAGGYGQDISHLICKPTTWGGWDDYMLRSELR